MKHIVVGGCGFIGSHLTAALIARGDDVVVIDNLFSGKLSNLDSLKSNKKLKFYITDFTSINEMRKLFEKEKPTTLFNLATIGLIRSLKNPIWTFRQEVMYAEIACQLALDGLYEKLIHFSSSEVYGNVTMPAIDPEMHETKPTTTYAAGKLAADHFIRVMTGLYKINSLIIRPFNTFGINQLYIDLQGIIPKTINLLKKGETITIYGNGLQTRDFIFVDDLLKRMFVIMRYHFLSPVENRRLIYQVCSEKEITMIDLINKIAKIGKFKLKIEFTKQRMGEEIRLIGKQTRLPNLEFPELMPLDAGIKHLIEQEDK